MGNVRAGRDIDAAFRKKGFRRELDGKHIWYYLVDSSGEDSIIKTMMSHGMMGSTIGSALISQMSRQLRLSKTQFLALVDCTLDEGAYRAILREQWELD